MVLACEQSNFMSLILSEVFRVALTEAKFIITLHPLILSLSQRNKAY